MPRVSLSVVVDVPDDLAPWVIDVATFARQFIPNERSNDPLDLAEAVRILVLRPHHMLPLEKQGLSLEVEIHG